MQLLSSRVLALSLPKANETTQPIGPVALTNAMILDVSVLRIDPMSALPKSGLGATARQVRSNRQMRTRCQHQG